MLELMVGHYQNFRWFWRYLPEYLEYYHNFRYLASLIHSTRRNAPEFLFICWDCFGGVRSAAEQAGVVGGGGAVADRDNKPVARLELGEVAAAQAEVDHGDARCVDCAAALRTTKSAPGALLTIITSISC